MDLFGCSPMPRGVEDFSWYLSVSVACQLSLPNGPKPARPVSRNGAASLRQLKLNRPATSPRSDEWPGQTRPSNHTAAADLSMRARWSRAHDIPSSQRRRCMTNVHDAESKADHTGHGDCSIVAITGSPRVSGSRSSKCDLGTTERRSSWRIELGSSWSGAIRV
jgi:hypothetical protein